MHPFRKGRQIGKGTKKLSTNFKGEGGWRGKKWSPIEEEKIVGHQKKHKKTTHCEGDEAWREKMSTNLGGKGKFGKKSKNEIYSKIQLFN